VSSGFSSGAPVGPCVGACIGPLGQKAGASKARPSESLPCLPPRCSPVGSTAPSWWPVPVVTARSVVVLRRIALRPDTMSWIDCSSGWPGIDIFLFPELFEFNIGRRIILNFIFKFKINGTLIIANLVKSAWTRNRTRTPKQEMIRPQIVMVVKTRELYIVYLLHPYNFH